MPAKQGHDLVAAGQVGAEESADSGGDHGRAWFVYAANSHAGVGGLHHHSYAASLELFVEEVGNLLGKAFLDLWLMRESINDAGELGYADDPLVGQVGDVGMAEERQEVVFADRVKGDVA